MDAKKSETMVLEAQPGLRRLITWYLGCAVGWLVTAPDRPVRGA